MRIGTLVALILAVTAASPADFTVAARWNLSGSGNWDYLTFDAPQHRLFIAHGDRVEVVNTRSGALIGQIRNTTGVHGIALAPLLKRGYTSNGHTNTVTEFNYETLAPLREVAVPGLNPDAILYEPGHHHLYTFNGHSKDATVFDARTLAVVAKLALPDTIPGDGQIRPAACGHCGPPSSSAATAGRYL